MFPCLSLIRQGGVGKEPKRMRMKDAQNDQGRRIRFKIVEKRFRPPRPGSWICSNRPGQIGLIHTFAKAYNQA